jgi:hypothetical protein
VSQSAAGAAEAVIEAAPSPDDVPALTADFSRLGRPWLARLISPQPSKEDTMATQIVMDHAGDSRHQFNPADAAAVAEAEERFKMLTGFGFTAAKRLGEGKSEILRSFDPTAEETLFIPRLGGG